MTFSYKNPGTQWVDEMLEQFSCLAFQAANPTAKKRHGGSRRAQMAQGSGKPLENKALARALQVSGPATRAPWLLERRPCVWGIKTQ